MIKLILFLLFSISYVLFTGDHNILHAILAGAAIFVLACIFTLALIAVAIMWIFQRGDVDQKQELIKILEG